MALPKKWVFAKVGSGNGLLFYFQVEHDIFASSYIWARVAKNILNKPVKEVINEKYIQKLV